MDTYIKVKDHPDLVRDKRSNGILNINNTELEKYRAERDARMRIQKTVEGYEKLRQDVDEIKDMLQQLIKKL